MYYYLEMCTGSFQENKKRPAPNTKCIGSCIQEAGRWGKNYCYTNKEKSQWGAECISCQDAPTTGVATGTARLL